MSSLHSHALRGHQSFLPCSFNGSAQPLLRKMGIWLLPPSSLSSGSSSSLKIRRSKLRLSIRSAIDDEVDPPIQPPQYISYDDISGEPGPAFSPNRNNLPDEPFWSADVPSIMRRSQADVPKKSSSSSSASSSKASKSKAGSRRRRKREESEGAEEAQSQQQSVQTLENKEEYEDEEEDEDRDEYVTYEDPDAKVPETKPVKDLTPLPDEKLWYNWRKIPPEKEPWHDFSRPPSDNFAVLAAAAAKTGQIKLFGEKPTVTETVLARVRKHALKKERIELEQKRRKEIGPMAYYSEWVKAWKQDCSKEAVQKRYEETGKTESEQLIEMFSHQTFAEYRVMMGTDPRIERDPLAIRMTLEQKKAIWGGDPVYPTVNYYQDPNQKIDYRGPNFHEPKISIFESLRKAGRLITREELKEMQRKEAANQLAMEQELEEAIADAVDIGEKEEEEKEEELELQQEAEDDEQEVEDNEPEAERDGKENAEVNDNEKKQGEVEE